MAKPEKRVRITLNFDVRDVSTGQPVDFCDGQTTWHDVPMVHLVAMEEGFMQVLQNLNAMLAKGEKKADR
ncbi:MAG: hypothetical protein ACYTG0_42460 [Planctomycetota bacterium]|jgi:hypothetical protein